MTIPKEIKLILRQLRKNGFEGYIVGGCVRDLLLKQKPKDWDCTTNATPEQIRQIFPQTFLDNDLGTVGVLTNSRDKTLKVIEITPFRQEDKYLHRRRPSAVKWVDTLDEDLKRRDFTINALALTEKKVYKGRVKYEIIDLFKGQEDLKNKIIRAVGDPDERFQEDALRLLRAARFAVCLNFTIEDKTFASIKKNSHLLQAISQERIRDELIKIINSPNAARGIELLKDLNLLQYIIPEILQGINIGQNKHHQYTVYEHSLRSLEYAAKQNFNQAVRIAALLHDVSKPQTKAGDGYNSTFYNHEIVGAKTTYQILFRLKFPKKDIEKITKLVRYHLFYYNVDEVSHSSIRRLIRKVGKENMADLIKLRMADRIGSGVSKAQPYKLRHLQYLIEKLSQDPLSTKKLKINGDKIMQLLNINPGPIIGYILTILLKEILDEPEKNRPEILYLKVKELGQLQRQDLKNLYQQAKEKIEEIESKNDQMTKEKYWVS
jgi:poly(A) polymerase/tRNA nucleotidyltransferase (CCA-adding enzyme)